MCTRDLHLCSSATVSEVLPHAAVHLSAALQLTYVTASVSNHHHSVSCGSSKGCSGQVLNHVTVTVRGVSQVVLETALQLTQADGHRFKSPPQ